MNDWCKIASINIMSQYQDYSYLLGYFNSNAKPNVEMMSAYNVKTDLEIFKLFLPVYLLVAKLRFCFS